MTTFTLTHEINCDADTFWKLFFDKDFNEKMYKDGLGFPEFSIIEQVETDTEWRRKAAGKPKIGNVPGPVAKVLGDGFRYVEQGNMNKKDRVWHFKLTTSVMADKIKQEGKVKVEPAGDGKVKRIAELFLEVKVFGIGGMIESATEKSLREGWDNSAKFMNKWIAERLNT